MKYSSIFLSLTFLASGCAHQAGLPDFYTAETEAKFGAAVRQNIAAQTVNPDAPDADALAASGARTAIAQDRYVKDEVEKPSATSTLEATTGNSDSDSK
jgi:type IV pilus biogenesis protein CpaD/CtpE